MVRVRQTACKIPACRATPAQPALTRSEASVIPEQVLHDRVVLVTADGEVQLQRRGLSIWPRPVRSEGKRREVPARQEEDHHGAVPVVRAQRRGRGR